MLFNGNIANLFDTSKYDLAKKLFLRLFYLWNFFHLLTLIPYHSLIWGREALINNYPFDYDNIFDWVFRLLVNEEWSSYYPVGIIVALVSLLYLMSRIGSWPVLIIYYIAIMNLHNKAYVILDGGNNLQELMLAYSILISLSIGRDHYILKTLSNAALYLGRVQVCLLYATAGLTKLTGPMWQKGVGLYYALSLSNYSNPYLSDIILGSDLIIALGSYYTVLFQIAFPFLIWSRKTRNIMLIMGFFLHLQISLVMGLFYFGLIMIVTYALFLNHLPLKKYELSILPRNRLKNILLNNTLIWFLFFIKDLIFFIALKGKNEIRV
jgi:hypothetical protein